MTKTPYHQWTMEEIKSVVSMWDDKTPKEICEELGIARSQLGYIVKSLRKEGVGLVNKRQNGVIRSLIKEFASKNGKTRRLSR